MRFLRPDMLPEGPPAEGASEPRYVNTFIADQSSQQLRALARAQNERHRRFTNLEARHAEAADGVEHLNWVRVGVLVSIPQPGFEQKRRPNKWAFLRCGPYEVLSISEGGGTVSLRDHSAHARNERSVPFTWPICWLFPYHPANVPPPLEVQPPPAEPQPHELPKLLMETDFDVALAILTSDPLPEPLEGYAATNVRNHVYRVRWRGRPHSEDSWEPYEAVWHQAAFQDFIAGSRLTGHVPPSAYARAHRQHVNALLRNQTPERDVPIVDPHAIDHELRDYLMLEQRTPLNSRALAASQQQQHAFQSQEQRSQENSDERNAAAMQRF